MVTSRNCTLKLNRESNFFDAFISFSKLLVFLLLLLLLYQLDFSIRLSFVLRLFAPFLPELTFGPIVLPSVGIVTFQICSILGPALRKIVRFQDPETFHENSATTHQILLAAPRDPRPARINTQNA